MKIKKTSLKKTENINHLGFHHQHFNVTLNIFRKRFQPTKRKSLKVT